MTRKSSKTGTPDVGSRLLHPTTDGESGRRSNIREWLHDIGFPRVEVEYDTGAGPADLYVPARRIVMEVKEKGRADDPNKRDTGSTPGETAFEQLSRYLESERCNEQRYLDEDDENIDQPWVGIVTDSQVWWIWEWNYTPKLVHDWKGSRLTVSNMDRLAGYLLDQKQVGKQWARPDNLREIFEGPLEDLFILYRNEKGSPDIETQRELWLRQLEVSGNAPRTEKDRDELFVVHTMLISISAHISSIYSKTERRFGFASWTKGTQWSENLVEKIRQYNWRQPRGDILRSLYMEMVGKEHRHLYGEYYTPDWLAENLCETVIDEQWIQASIAAYFDGGMEGCVLDPACGSGTLLYHAAKRIMESEAVKKATMTDSQITDMLVKTLAGIDIHPVAVEMTRANLIRILPHRPQDPLRVYQGDSLQIDRDTGSQSKLVEAENRLFVIRSRGDRKIGFPREFIMTESFAADVERFASAASKSGPFPPGLDRNLVLERRAVLREAFRTLTEVCEMEGNDIWAWYTINQVGVYKLRGTVSRMISNPPWVRAAFIQDRIRKAELEDLAKPLGVWAGGKNATSVNLGAIFVVQCRNLYGATGVVSGWVLPWSAIKSNNWKAYREKALADVVWDLGRLPFPTHSEACVNIFGVEKQPLHRLELSKGEDPPGQHDSWNMVRERTSFVRVRSRRKTASAWISGKRSIARQGATITPLCLLALEDGYKTRDETIHGKTVMSTQGNWKGRGGYPVSVPVRWLHYILTANCLLPYAWGAPRPVVMPVDGNGNFMEGATKNKYWKKAVGLYDTYRGTGTSTPKTLHAQLDYNGKMSKQFPIVKNMTVICNGSGSSLRAARQTGEHIIDHTLYRILTRSVQEARFLVSILNAECMQSIYRSTKPSKFHFNTNFWFEVPIPRFDENDPDHTKLVELAETAEAVAAGVEKQTKNGIRDALCKDGVSKDIDRIVTRVIKMAKDKLATE